MRKFIGRIRVRRYLRPFVPSRLNRGKADSKSIRTILEIVGESIALAVLIVMVFQYTLSRKAIEKMAEQNALSAGSLARIDSTIKLMHEANQLVKESNDLTKENIKVELGKLDEDRRKTAIEENRLQEELRPMLVINPIKTADIKSDSANNYSLWITIENVGESGAESVILSTTIATDKQVLPKLPLRPLGKIPPKRNAQVVPLNLLARSEDLFILTEVSYKWVLPSGSELPFVECKAHWIEYDSSANEYVRCGKLDEDDINLIFKKGK
jgi:hypothetical protein